MQLDSKISSLVALLFVQSALLATEPNLPDGWRYPTARELADPDRANSPTKYARATADFNADGILDVAFLLKSTRFSGQALLLRLSCRAECVRWVTLDSIDWGPEYPHVDLAMGIDTIPPGNHEYLCIEVGDECAVPEHDGPRRPRITIETPALVYYRFESAGSFFYWDRDKATFIRVWTSD